MGTPVAGTGYKSGPPVGTLDRDPGGTLSQETTDARVGRGVKRPYPKRSEAHGKRRASGPAFLSIALHVVVGAALLRVLLIPYPFTSLFATKEQSVEPERISFLALPQSPTTENSPGKSGGNGRPETPKKAAPAPPLVAPTEVPSTLPPVSPAATPTATVEEEGTGPLIGRGGATKGIRPSYSDPRIWVPAAPVVSAPKSADARMDSVVAAGIEHARDSMAASAYSPNKFERGDWTYEKDGKKYGIDNQYIRLGKFAIPNVLLGLLPLNAQGNPIAADRDRAMASLRQEILYQSQRSMNEAEFRKAVKSLRERKERERQQQEKDRQPKPISAAEPRSTTPAP